MNIDQINNPFSSNISLAQEPDSLPKVQIESTAIAIESEKIEDSFPKHPTKLKKIEAKAPKMVESWNEKRSYRGATIIRIKSAEREGEGDSFWKENDHI